ncbi:myb-like protein U isoform X1 [Colias croceus]|uniref:myb-like protein U isoform X1 n=1 Tax=Colias crocea TaxID=72248 RepID=UPI001E2819C7|nr:myb-like protein U isoform X1 [Colias croceus]
MNTITIPKPRKRNANFTQEEKDLLCYLVSRSPIVESKSTDGETIAKKKTAWKCVADEFNYNSRVHKRHVTTLKRAWENMKFRKSFRSPSPKCVKNESMKPNTESIPNQPLPILQKLKEAAADTVPEFENYYDSDGPNFLEIECKISQTSGSNENLSFNNTDGNHTNSNNDISSDIAYQDLHQHSSQNLSDNDMKNLNKDNVMRFRHSATKKEIEMQILRIKLETEKVKKRTALLEEEKSKILLEKAKLELEAIRNSFKD